ncbi:MOSC N-terminal beta barrel domain-containing protein [Oscillatoria sp. FACHB-1407]|uniref:MOSC domain-containing protein n=1 Tax=Oscillatoria sp. FACHB-1407 TaxID=2692847 RepID=UPI0016839005|nr:MOSC N-terminal beta barrel domain-containing protein [Oscillatoria sp. FACHB-1407]MBD2463744.1 MOSC N-terminal beta barrel domain-containing protein [Oscillatoria sp. FACHB-1407]
MAEVKPYVSKLFIYPIKSLDRVGLDRGVILKQGGLKGDREFAIVDESGQFVNGKRNSKVHRLRTQFDLAANTVSLHVEGEPDQQTFHLETDQKALEAWLSRYFGVSVSIKHNLETGFPDDLESPGPTVISTATLEAIASWYPDLDVEQIRLRLRANIEIAGVPPFWEDCLFATAEQVVDFQIGSVKFMGVNPCQRCVVVTRDAQTGEAYPQFQKTFVAKRQETLPAWAERSRFNHFYRLAVNTRLPASEEGKEICVGDRLIVNSDGKNLL